jgi:hypothetical protein
LQILEKLDSHLRLLLKAFLLFYQLSSNFFDLTFILGYDLFVLFESARGGHYPAVPGLLSMDKFCSVVRNRSPWRGTELYSHTPRTQRQPRQERRRERRRSRRQKERTEN